MLRLIHTSRSPFELWLLAAAVISGVGALFAPGRSGRIVEHLPHWGQMIWYGGLAAFGAVALVGALTSRLWSLYVERGALTSLGALCLVYAAIVVISAGVVVAFSAVLILGLAAACLARARQITVDIRHVATGENGT